MGYLKYIELENFKSYRGHIKIGPFKTFTAIIGPNGSGKSNLMDAISFVLGESTKNLRVKKLSDLIHGAPISKPVSNRASVSFVYSYDSFPAGNVGARNGNAHSSDTESSSASSDNENEIRFTRTVIGAASEYRIDGRVVSQVDYQNELEKIGIYLRAKNFLVYQGQVESIATKNAKELTQMLEEVSRSGELKEEYDRLKTEMEKAEHETQANFQKKRGVAAQKKEARQEKEEAEKYERARKELQAQELQLRLFQLYYNEKANADVRDELETRQSELKQAEARREAADAEIRERKKVQNAQAKAVAKIEELIKDIEVKMAKKKPQAIKTKEQIAHVEKKCEAAKQSYEAALKAHQTHEKEIKSINEDITKLEKERKDFESTVHTESLSQGVNLELRASQMKTYQKLKEEAARRNVKFQEELEGLQREQKLDQDSLDNEMRKKNDASSKVKQKEAELEEQRLKLSKLIEYINNTETQITQQTEAENKMSQEIDMSKTACKELEDELAKIMNDIGDARIDKFESSRTQKKAEVIEQLKKKFPGVYGRLMDHCEPVHRKYQLAITKVMGKSMDAIVVDTEQTARECIQFMKEQHMSAETFYPLDFIEASPLDERLRDIREAPRGTKLLIDVIKFNPPAIKKALLFSIGNCLVCESDEDARTLAFGHGQERHKVVSFDGTLFQKSGLISGGSSELKQKARRWDEKHLDALRKKKDTLSDQLKEHLKSRRREPELADLRSMLKGLEHRLKYSKQSRDQLGKTIGALELELDELRKSIVSHEPRIGEIEKRQAQRAERLKKVRADANRVEDEVFGEFCREIGVNNIRIYEEREIAGQMQIAKTRMAFVEKLNQLNSRLEFESSRDTMKSCQKWEAELEKNQKELAMHKKEGEKLQKEIEDFERDIDAKKNSMETERAKSSELENEVNELKKKLAAHTKEANDIRKKITVLETSLLDKELERHGILKTAKIDLVKLPMIVGSMDDITDDDSQMPLTQAAALTQSSSSVSQQQQQQHTESLNTLSSTDQTLLFQKEARIKINYKMLDTEYLNLETEDEINKMEAKISARINEQNDQMLRFQAPSSKVDEKLNTVSEMWHQTADEFDKARMLAKKARSAFMKVKQERYDRFMKCFDHINGRIDDIYKALCMNPGAQASLVLENVEDPYAEGIIYNCVAPGKRFRQMDNLSGGEKTVAALALLFAIRSYNPAPFFVLDEVDAALDNTNISKVANFINEQSTNKGLQCVVISLKEEFFQHAHALIGVYPIADECIVSNILSLDLTDINEE